MRVWMYHKVLPAGKIFDESELTQKLIDDGWVDSPEELELNEFGRTDVDFARMQPGNTPETVRRHRGEDDNRSGPKSDGQGNKPGRGQPTLSKRPTGSKGKSEKESSVDSKPGRNTLLSTTGYAV